MPFRCMKTHNTQSPLRILQWRDIFFLALARRHSIFQQHASEEQQHADWIATRITQLNGAPDFNPEGLSSRAHSEYAEGTDLISMIREDLFAERIAIESYSEIVRWIGGDDPTSRKIIEDILKMEEEHAEDLKALLEKMS